MKKRKSTGFALLLSFCSMLLCIVALIGTSFAWFTSTDTVAVNKIRAGTLGIELVDSSGNKLSSGLDFYKTDSNGSVSTDVVWEPGSTYRTKSLYIKNVGDLDVVYKYIVSIPQLAAAVVAEGAETNTEVNQSATLFDSIDFSIVVCDSLATGEGVDPEVCRFLWNKDSYTMEVGEDTLNGDNVKWPGEKPTELPDIFSLPAQTVESMQSEGINSRYYIYMEGTMKSDASASVMGAVISGIQITAYAYQSNGNEESGETNNVVTITSEAKDGEVGDVYVSTLNENNTTYKFVGNFSSITITTDPGLNQTFDGSAAKVSGQVKIGYSQIVDNISTVAKGVEKSGDYIVKGFVATSVGVAAYNTSVTICDNTVQFIDYDGGNVNLSILNNTVDSQNTGHYIYNTANSTLNNYGVYIYAVNYNLIFSGNTISNTSSHAFAINGRVYDIAKELSVDNVTNIISEVKNNNIAISAGKSAFKIWDDTVYAPTTVTDVSGLTQSAKDFIDLVNNETTNSFTISESGTVFNIYDLKLDSYQ